MDGMLMAVTFFVCLPLLALLSLGCLLYGRGKDRKHLAIAAAVLCGSLFLFLGGEVILGCFDLTWRNLPAAVLMSTALGSGFVGLLLTLGCFLPMELPKWPRVLLWSSKLLSLVCAGLVVYHALLYGFLMLMFALRDEEKVIEHQGQVLVEVDTGFLDPIYDYYEYCGPLFRGNERLYSSQYTHIWGDYE